MTLRHKWHGEEVQICEHNFCDWQRRRREHIDPAHPSGFVYRLGVHAFWDYMAKAPRCTGRMNK